jgi:prolyl oligopeptidase
MTAPTPIASTPPSPPSPAPLLPYPATPPGDVKDTLHGVEVADPYRWLEDAKAPAVREWMKAEDDLARAELHKLPERDGIAARLKELFYVDSLSPPAHRGDRYFYVRRHATKEKAIVYYKRGKKGEEKVLFDPNGWSTDGSTSLGSWRTTWDGKTVAFTTHVNNSDEATLYVEDVETGKRSAVDVIEGAKYAEASWTPKGDGFYYTWLPTDPAIQEKERPGYAEVRYHPLGQDPKKDLLIHEKTGDSGIFQSVELSRDGHWLLLYVQHGWTSVDVYFKDLRGKVADAAAKEPWIPLAAGTGAHYEIDVYKDAFYVFTDDGAPRSRVLRIDPRTPERSAWKEIIPEHPDATLLGSSVIGGRLTLHYLKNASSSLTVREMDGRPVREVALPGVGTSSGFYGRDDEDEAYFTFDSFTTPPQVFSTSVKTGKAALYAKVEVPVDPAPYAVEQVFYPSKDGTKVSMFLVHRKDLKKDGTTRAMLYGYGGFRSTETPTFRASIFPWLERGGLYAVPNLRGGSEYGEAWHKDGMLLKKQNVFDDFIAAGEYLVREGYTKPERLVISGASNGGLLVAAAMTQRPDLFGAVLCGVPLIDMVRYHLSRSGATWVSEYGSAENEEQFRALLAYSPYHHVVKGTRYPSVLLLSADSDDRVDPAHARKFAAELQAATTGGPVLLRIERNSGHGGADLLKAEVEKGADRYAFALAHTGGG